MSVVLQEFSNEHRQNLLTLREECKTKDRVVELSTYASAFLCIGALIVITCSCLCLTLPGVNAITQVILPAVVPGIVSIGVSIPFIILAVRFSAQKNVVRNTSIECMVSYLNEYRVAEAKKQTRKDFIYENLLNWERHPKTGDLIKKKDEDEYQTGIIREIINDYIGEEADRKGNLTKEKLGRTLDSIKKRMPSNRDYSKRKKPALEKINEMEIKS